MRCHTLLLPLFLFIVCSHALAKDVDTNRVLKSEGQFAWPDGALAAVCLTYDDGLDGHLDCAAPDLEAHGFRGTVYCPGYSRSLNKRMEEWRALAKRGHELGNHSLFHPCKSIRSNGKERAWVVPEYALENYTIRRMKDELWVANSFLKAVDGKKDRTYGYTCSESDASGNSSIPEIRKFFTGARSNGPVPITMTAFDRFHAPSLVVNDHSSTDLIAQTEEAAKNGTVAIFMLHSVGGGYLNVSSESHREFLDYLAKNKSRFYVAPFIEVINWVHKKSLSRVSKKNSRYPLHKLEEV